jgi:hypothetical protein
MRSSCSRMCGTASAASGVLTVMRTSSLPAWASSLHLDGGADGVHRVGVGHRLHTHRRVAAHGDHVVAPGHTRLAAAARRRRRGAMSMASEECVHRPDLDFKQLAKRLLHCNSTRATFSRVRGARSTACPRKLTWVPAALPMVSRMGSAAVQAHALTRLHRARQQHVPRASRTSTHEASLLRSCSRPAAPGLPRRVGSNREAGRSRQRVAIGAPWATAVASTSRCTCAALARHPARCPLGPLAPAALLGDLSRRGRSPPPWHTRGTKPRLRPGRCASGCAEAGAGSRRLRHQWVALAPTGWPAGSTPPRQPASAQTAAHPSGGWPPCQGRHRHALGGRGRVGSSRCPRAPASPRRAMGNKARMGPHRSSACGRRFAPARARRSRRAARASGRFPARRACAAPP